MLLKQNILGKYTQLSRSSYNDSACFIIHQTALKIHMHASIKFQGDLRVLQYG